MSDPLDPDAIESEYARELAAQREMDRALASGFSLKWTCAEDPHDGLESQWQANEIELNRLHAATGLDRELNVAEIDRLEGEQDRIECLLGMPPNRLPLINAKDFEAATRIAAQSLLNTKLAPLGGMSLGQIITWDHKRESKVKALAKLIVDGATAKSLDLDNIYASHVGAAAALAYFQLVEDGEAEDLASLRVESTVLPILRALTERIGSTLGAAHDRHSTVLPSEQKANERAATMAEPPPHSPESRAATRASLLKVLESSWQKHERERDQIAAAGGLEDGLEFIIENLDKEQDFIEWFLGCPPGPTLRWSGMPVCRYFAPKSWEGSLLDDEIAMRPPALLGRRVKQLDTEPKEEQSMLSETEPEQFVERYRGLIAQLDVARDEVHRAEVRVAAKRLRDRWKEWQGEDSLHEMAFGEPIE